ncbi:MAG: glucose-1-phosphate adenylyltransferase, partial [Pseudomonadota bacterium]
YQGPVAKIIDGQIKNSIIGSGTVINGASIRNSIVRREVFLDEGVELDDCVIMDYTIIRKGVKLKRCIVDRYNTLEPNTHIGFDREADAKRFHVSESGLVVVPRGREMNVGRFF